MNTKQKQARSDRVKKCRKLQREGTAVVQVAINKFLLMHILVHFGLLRRDQIDDRRARASALEKLLHQIHLEQDNTYISISQTGFIWDGAQKVPAAINYVVPAPWTPLGQRIAEENIDKPPDRIVFINP